MISIKPLFTKILSRLARLNGIYTATCATAASTAAKVATLNDSTDFSLTAGTVVIVTFTYGNSATTPTLNVNSTGAKTIAIPSSATAFVTGSGTSYNTWGARETLIFTYTGTYWTHLPSGRLGYLTYKNKANIASPTFTGTPNAPTASAGTNTTQIATTAFVQTAISTVGTEVTYTSTSDVSIPTSTGTEVANVTLSAGNWILIGTCTFGSNTSGVRRLNISTVSGSDTWQVSYPSATSGYLTVQVTRVVTASSSTTYYLNAWQNSGSTLTCPSGRGVIEAVRIL